MKQTETERLDKVLIDEQLGTQQLELLNRWAKHVRTYQTDSKTLESAYTVREFGLFLKKPYELASLQDLDGYLDYKRETGFRDQPTKPLNRASIYGYRRRISLFYQWMQKHTAFTVHPDIAYYKPKLVKRERKSLEELHKIRLVALLRNQIILTNRKEDRKLSPMELNIKYAHLLLDEKNLRILNDFYNYKITSGKVLSHVGFVSKIYLLKRLGLHLKTKDKTFKEVTREDIQDFLAEVQTGLTNKKRAGSSGRINSSYKAHLLDFYRFVYGMFTEEQPRIYPPVVAWLYQKRKKSEDRVAKEIIPSPEIKAMLDKAPEARDRALIALFSDCSARIGEVVNTNIKDLKINDVRAEGAQYAHSIATITLRGKTGERTNQLFYSVPHLRIWLMHHPMKDNPDAPLFIATKESRYGQRITPTGINKILQRAATKAKVTRHIHAHLFRHTNLTRMAQLLSETELKIHAGWGMDSDMATVYVHLTERDVANKLLQKYGLATQETKAEAPPCQIQICPNSICSYQNPGEAKFCLKCGYPLNLQLALNLADLKKKEEDLHSGILAKNLDSTILNGKSDLKEMMFEVLKRNPQLIEQLRDIMRISETLT